MLKYLESPLSQPPYLELFQSRGGPVEAFFGGASLETFSGEAQLKKHPVVFIVETISPSLLSMIDCQHAEEVSISITIEANSNSLGGPGDFAILELQSL